MKTFKAGKCDILKLHSSPQRTFVHPGFAHIFLIYSGSRIDSDSALYILDIVPDHMTGNNLKQTGSGCRKTE